SDRQVLLGPVSIVREYLYDTSDQVEPNDDRPSNAPWLIQPAPFPIAGTPIPGVESQQVILYTQYGYDQQGNLRRIEKRGRVDDNDIPHLDNTIVHLAAEDNKGLCLADWACLPQIARILEFTPGTDELAADTL